MFRFPAVLAGFRRFTLVLYGRQQKTKKSGEVAFFRGKLPVMARDKTKEVQGDKTVSVQAYQEGKKRIGRPRIPVSEADQKKAIEAARLGIPLERVAILCGFPSGNAGRWHDFLKRNPDFADLLEKARLEGELELTSVVRQCGNGWQGSAWLLERTRGYVARASLEHTGKGGKELSISGNLLGAFGGGNK
jgi:hypothetical protein